MNDVAYLSVLLLILQGRRKWSVKAAIIVINSVNQYMYIE